MKKYSLTLLFLFASVFFAHNVFAQNPPPVTAVTDYKLLAPIPLNGANGAPTTNLNPTLQTYIPGVVKLTIGIATGLAVLMIMIGGLHYITSATTNGKSSGKEMITNALIGLLLAISSYVLLNTINPDLVNLTLTVTPLKMAGIEVGDPNAPPTTPTTPSSPNSTCTGCVDVKNYSFPAKSAAQGGCAGAGPCTIDPQLGSRLKALAGTLAANNITDSDWQVTEMYPPKVPHASSCHDAGTCVDAKLVSPSDPHQVSLFLKSIAAAVGPSFLYEAPTCTRLKQLQSSSELQGFKSQMKVCKTTTGENVHINLSGGGGGSCGTGGDGTSNEITC